MERSAGLKEGIRRNGASDWVYRGEFQNYFQYMIVQESLVL
jgi:hypothetical protein